MQGIIYIVLAAPFLLNGGAGWKVYKRIGRVLSRKSVAGVGAEESGADFFFGAHCLGGLCRTVCVVPDMTVCRASLSVHRSLQQQQMPAGPASPAR